MDKDSELSPPDPPHPRHPTALEYMKNRVIWSVDVLQTLVQNKWMR